MADRSISRAVGSKNVAFGVGLFIVMGVLVGIPLTINFFGGAVLTDEQYQTWKVVHGYGVFLGFINYFFGLAIDRLDLPRRQKELSSWSFLAASAVGGLGRMVLVLVSGFERFGLFASLAEVVFVTAGTALFVAGQIRSRRPVAAAAAVGP